MAIQLDHETPADAELIGSRIGRINPEIFENQSENAEKDTNDELDDEPVDDDGLNL